MSAAKPGADQSADLVDAPFLDDAERVESEWLLASAQDPAAPAPSPELARDYADLEALLEGLPAGDDDDGWHDEVLRLAAAQAPETAPVLDSTHAPGTVKLRAADEQLGRETVPALTDAPAAASERPRSRRVRRWAAAGALTAITAAVVVAVMVRPPPPNAQSTNLQIEIRREAQTRGDESVAAIGDRLLVRARPVGTGEVRVYRVIGGDGALVGRCPAGPRCTGSADGALALDVALDVPAPHYVVIFEQLTRPLPVGAMSEDLQAARAMNARYQMKQITVH